MARKFLVPQPGLSIPSKDHKGALPEGGGWVEDSFYWLKRFNAGDVTDDTAAQIKREAEADKKAALKAPKTQTQES